MPTLIEGIYGYRPVQNLSTVTIHPVVPNPYTLISLIAANTAWFTILDLKHAFFCLCLAPGSFQLSWTRLPQGFKNSPAIFGEALATDLKAYIPLNKDPNLRVAHKSIFRGSRVLLYLDSKLITHSKALL
ncbi:Gag-Pol polyprotein [Plecturocebus cupreus]